MTSFENANEFHFTSIHVNPKWNGEEKNDIQLEHIACVTGAQKPVESGEYIPFEANEFDQKKKKTTGRKYV